MARGECRLLPTDSICMVVTGTAVIFYLAGRQDRQYVSPLSIIYNDDDDDDDDELYSCVDVFS